MKSLFAVLAALVLIIGVIGCSDDNNPTNSNPPNNTGSPVLQPIGSKTAYISETLSFEVVTTDADSTVPKLSVSGLPVGATFLDNADGTGSFSWSPEESELGYDSIVFYAKDRIDSTDVDSEIVEVTVTFRGTTTSTYDLAGGVWRTKIDASGYSTYTGFSFAAKDTTLSVTEWDVAFRRESVKLNGGASSTGGNATAVNLGAVDFATVAVGDTAGRTWVEDQIEYFFDNWYTYTGPPLHQLLPNRNVYSMLDASGHHYVKFRIDSLTGAGMPPDMGTVWLTYYYQPTADNLTLPGPTISAHFAVESGTVYFDFSSGSVVTPTTPSNSTEWDLGFSAYNVFQNSGPNGSGDCKGFYAYTELTDPTDIDGFTSQPAGAPLFPDIPSSALTDWYDYTGPPLHRLLSKDNVYLLKTGDKVYKMMIESYYANVGGVPTSGIYTFIWKEL